MFSADVLQRTRNPDLKGRTEVIRGSVRLLVSAVNYGAVYGMIYVTMSQTRRTLVSFTTPLGKQRDQILLASLRGRDPVL